MLMVGNTEGQTVGVLCSQVSRGQDMQLSQAGDLHSVPGRGVSQKTQQEIPTPVATPSGWLAGLFRGETSRCTGPSSK